MDYEVEILSVWCDGGDYAIDFTIDGVQCGMTWDPDSLLNALLKGMTKEEVIEALGLD